MGRIKTIKFLVNDDQYHRIKRNASLKGHVSVSSYLRSLTLERDLYYENIILKTFNIVKEMNEDGKRRQLRTEMVTGSEKIIG